MRPDKFIPVKCTLIAFVITMGYVSLIALFLQ